MYVRVQQRLEQYIEVREVLEPGILGQSLQLRRLAVRTHAVRDAALRDLHGEVEAGALAAAAVHAAEHGHHLLCVDMGTWLVYLILYVYCVWCKYFIFVYVVFALSHGLSCP